MSEHEPGLTGAQIRDVMLRGMSLSDAKELAASGLTFEDICEIADAQASRTKGNNAEIADSITQGIKEAKEPIPENKASNGISDSNPLGVSSPRPGFKCEMWMGVVDDKGDVKPWYEIEQSDVTIWEECALNTLEPIESVICSLGSDRPDLRIRVEARRDSISQKLLRLMVAVPLTWVQKGPDSRKGQIPPITEIVRQLNGCDFRRREMSLETLKQVQAAQRAGDYTAQPKVAA
jgi:hypothetical protein